MRLRGAKYAGTQVIAKKPDRHQSDRTAGVSESKQVRSAAPGRRWLSALQQALICDAPPVASVDRRQL